MFRISLKRLLMLVCALAMTSMAWAQGASGDIFVSADVEGVPVLIDGEETGERTPAMLKGVALGTHEVAIETECGRDTAEVTVTDGRIARADLKAPTGQGTLRILPDPVDAQIYLDGEQVLGKEPFASLDCGMHRVEVRACSMPRRFGKFVSKRALITTWPSCCRKMWREHWFSKSTH